ncbi:MAG: sulfatase-like hydrolase/transferase [Bacteroidales bacterium]
MSIKNNISFGKWYSGLTLQVVVFRLAAVLLLLMFSRLSIYFFSPTFFSDLTFGHLLFLALAGLRFDLFTLAILNIPFIFLNLIPWPVKYSKPYQWVSNFMFYVLNGLAFMTNFGDAIYFRFTQKRMTFGIFEFIGENKSEINALLLDFITDYWIAFIVWIFFLLLLVFIGRQIEADPDKRFSYSWRNYRIDIISLIIGLTFIIVAARGGLQNKPIDLITAGNYTQPKFFPVVLNTPFTMLKSIDRGGLKVKEYYTNEKELAGIFTPVIQFNNPEDSFKKLNVVIVIVESLTTEHSGYLNPKLENGYYKGYTPFLDSLMKQSLVFRGFANGEESMNGIPAILAGIPSLMDRPFLISPYVSNEFNSIAGILRQKGYSTAFYHGGTNGTMGFDSFAKIAGFDSYLGRNEYNNEADFDGNWGIFDEPFLQYTAKHLNETPEPFFATVYTLSSHHPFTIPEKYKNKFPKGTYIIHESIGYADFALERFFDEISNSSWFNNTLFVITADHTYGGYNKFYQTWVGRYSIPIIFYHSNLDENLKKVSDLTVQQTDIFPTILDALNYHGDIVAFGRSVFDTIHERVAVAYKTGTYQTIKEGYVYHFNGEADLALYNYKNDSLLSRSILTNEKVVADDLRAITKAYIQQFNNRMINNQLTVEHK